MATSRKRLGLQRHRGVLMLALAAVTLVATGAGSFSSLATSSASAASKPTNTPDKVTSLPGLGSVGTQFAGYSSVNTKACSNVRCSAKGDAGLFYWFVGKTGGGYATAPTILWTNGGPGSTSFWGFFTENGPYVVNPGGTLQKRP